MKEPLLIGGDVAPTPENYEAFSSGDLSALFTEGLGEVWLSANARIVNLECPLADRATPIEKCGAAMRAPLSAAAGLGAMKLTAAALANNHILDQGEPGLRSTMEALARQRIPSFGAGRTQREADGAYTFLLGKTRVSLYGVCEHEYSVAEGEAPGANGFDPLEIADRLRALKKACDYLIVLYHGGREYYPYPSPLLQKRCRKMAAAGADLVLCQHSHCIGCYEKVDRATIVYGQGNLLFDLPGEPPAFDRGLVVSITLSGETPEISYLPVERKNHGTALLQGAEKEAVLAAFEQRSAELRTEGFVAARYRQYAEESREKLLKVFLSGNKLLRAVNLAYGRRPSRVYSKATLLAIRNSLECESIHELLTEGLK